MTEPGVELEIEGVGLRFGGVQALADVTLEHRTGEILGIVGPNGAGKTSLINCITAFYRPDRGSIRYRGRELVGLAPQRIVGHGIVRTFQNIEVLGDQSVIDNVLMGRHRFLRYGFVRSLIHAGRVAREEAYHRRKADEALEAVGLLEHSAATMSNLPYGTQKLVEVARALAAEPQTLVLDEPAAGTGARERVVLAESIRAVRANLGVSVILIEHDVDLVMSLCDRVAVLDWGRLIACGTPAQVRADPAVIKAYLGTAEAAPDEDEVRAASGSSEEGTA